PLQCLTQRYRRQASSHILFGVWLKSGMRSSIRGDGNWTNENHDIIWRVGDGYSGEYHDVDKP
ncbi:hypothetical protein, partial [Pseudomonas yamanorum]|uniref:hypothetical protein n=1 Tax=Pseudomonas yamanorum TaxID=515393 RepID=UPI001C430B8E